MALILYPFHVVGSPFVHSIIVRHFSTLPLTVNEETMVPLDQFVSAAEKKGRE